MFHPVCPERLTSASRSISQDFLCHISHIPTDFCFFFCFSSMARRSDSFLFLVLAGILLVEAAMADGNDKSEVAMMNPSEVKVEDQPEAVAASAASSPSSSSEAEAPDGIRKMGKHHSDKSVAGGGVIIGGLVTAIFAAVFCYIRVTRRRDDAAAAAAGGGGGGGHCGR